MMKSRIEGRFPFDNTNQQMDLKLVFASVCCFAIACVEGRPNDFSFPVKRMKGVVAPIYLRTSPTPSAILRVENIHFELQRKGFFRIGLLRLWIAEGVEIEVRDCNEVADSLSPVHATLKSFHGNSPIELRRVAFRFAGESFPRLQAGRVRLGDDGRWRLSDSVSIQKVNGREEIPSAVLDISGPNVGALAWETPSGLQSMNLFVPYGATNSMAIKSKIK
jgi:hypothetical protein